MIPQLRRLLTCYSAIIYLAAEVRMHQTVTPEAARMMVATTPTARLEHVAGDVTEAQSGVGRILENYSGFLATCDADKKTLEDEFSEGAFKRARFAEAKEFGDEVFRVLQVIGVDTPLFRYLLV